MASSPAKKDVVHLLLQQKPDVFRDVTGRTGANIRENVRLIVFACLMGDRCKIPGSEVVAEKNSGYTNLYKHLKTCLSGGDEKHLVKRV